MNAPVQTSPATRAASVLVLGLGNDLLSDDGVGLRLAAALEKHLGPQPRVTIRQTAEMGLSLLDLVCGFDTLILVDAVQTGSVAPGCAHEMDISQLASLAGGSPHFLGVREVLDLGRALGLDMPREARLFAVEVKDPFTLSQDLTGDLVEAFPGLLARLTATVGEVLAKANGPVPVPGH